MRVALYARVSTREQETDNQMIRLREFAERRGYEVYGEYRDVVSGAKDKRRPDQERMLADARHRRFDKIIAIKLDRVGRSLIDLFNILQNLEAWGTELEIVDQPIDTSTAVGRFITTIIGAAAEYERELIVERTNDGLARARKKGKKLGPPVRDDIPIHTAALLRHEGSSWREVAEALSIPKSTLLARKREIDNHIAAIERSVNGVVQNA